ncbi:galectin-1-like [Notechis scutatus]|uniref:Galectin n=1 Tax=Notechis scutatus TaxID=8663 RepID=A0A6J1WCM3_9SAUR|nr:galectin-1-like [Notechis scutatus]
MPGIVCSSLRIQPGQKVAVKGDIQSGCEGFVINLGKDQDNLALHFNARFNAHGDVRTIVCNSRNKGQWGKELRETNFPFQEGETVEVVFTNDKKEVNITLPGGHQFKFPNETGLETIEFICTEGGLNFRSLSLV